MKIKNIIILMDNDILYGYYFYCLKLYNSLIKNIKFNKIFNK